MKITLRDYQQSLYDDVGEALVTYHKVAVALATGGGKSVIIGQIANNMPGRTLILTHRAEILHQNAAWINGGILTAKENTVMLDSKVVVAMVQTLHARIEKYGIDYIGSFDNIILDEIQIMIFDKVVKKYNYNKLIGFTATPVLNIREKKLIDKVEFSRQKTLACMFDTIICGADSQELIDLGFLNQDYNVILRLPMFDKLKESESAPDGYTRESLDEVYSNTASLSTLMNGYDNYCKGKKTLIFNASTKINKIVYDYFLEKGLNVKVFDTVNDVEINPKTNEKYTRTEIIEWFRNERDAILINTNVFTTGFDVDDVECIIMNRATKSLSLFIQIAGRGSRITEKIYKDKFTFLDLGQNIYEHGRWSLPRDWASFFKENKWRRVHKEDLMKTWNCKECDSINVAGELVCCVCGAEKPAAEGRMKKLKDGSWEEVTTFPVPRGKKIIQYTKIKGQDANFAFRLAHTQIIELFLNYRVSKEFYLKNQERLEQRVYDIFRPIYFTILSSDLKGANKKLKTQTTKLLTKINKMYV